MHSTSTALAIAQPAALATLDLDAGLVAWLYRRQQDRYFRPLVSAPSVTLLALRTAVAWPLFLVESRVASVVAVALFRRLGIPAGQLADAARAAHAELAQKLDSLPGSDEMRRQLDYALYTFFRAVIAQFAGRPAQLRFEDLPAAAVTAARSELYLGCCVFAAENPDWIRNPLVLAEIARRSVKAADALLAILASLGILGE